jgi:hypothetical protein
MRFWIGLFAFIGLIIAAQMAPAQGIMERLITPGPLSNAHAKLEANCNACHVSFSREAQNGKCLACHKGIAGDIQQGSGFHGKSTAKSQPCKVCHSEHHGRGFELSHFNRATFNHQFTDYPLVGGHAKAKCAGCHGASTHFRATSKVCASCHAKKEPHLGRLGKNCQACHTEFDWKKQKPFDHSKTGFALTGSHRALACLQCHAGQRWAGTPQQCYGCHAKNDAHKGTRGTNCASCHSTGGWRATSFNHNQDTSFPLVGRHNGVACAGCHGAGNSIPHPAHNCFACHAKDDNHKGSRGTNCGSCHSPASWKSATFDHNKDTGFPLLGKHASTTCAGCHGVGNSKPKPSRACFGCHEKDDSHKGNNGKECGKCHNSKDWKVTSFDHDTMTRFALTGAHKPVKCEACHLKPTHVELPPVACVGCHKDDDKHAGHLGTKCADCHNSIEWKDHSLFDHELTRFPLLGKHATVKCEKCHVDKTFSSKGITCQSCHVDDHHLGTLGVAPACAKCHTVAGWKIWKFDHDTATSFPLTGKHIGLICSACHVRKADPSKQSTACVDCHTRDDIHHGNFGNDCERCHVTSSFSDIIM